MCDRPTAELVRHVLCREAGPGDMFVVSALHCWCKDHEDRLAELVAALLCSVCPPPSPNKRKRNKASGNPSAETLLAHLDSLRPGCRQLYKLDCMQRALHNAQVYRSEHIQYLQWLNHTTKSSLKYIVWRPFVAYVKMGSERYLESENLTHSVHLIQTFLAPCHFWLFSKLIVHFCRALGLGF